MTRRPDGAAAPAGGADDTLNPAEDNCLSTKDLAHRWGLSIRTIEGWRLRNQGPAFLRLNRRIVYRLSDILAFEVAKRMDPAAQDPGGPGNGSG